MKLPYSYWACDLKAYMNENTGLSKDMTNWHPVRPIQLTSLRIFYRIKLAWDVFTGKADAVYWELDND